MAINLTDIRDYCVIQSGQFIINDLSRLNFTLDTLWMIVNRCVKIYDKYHPVSKKTRSFIYNSFTFPDPSPMWISKVYPTGVVSTYSIFGVQANPGNPIPVIFKYERPTLYVTNVMEVEITAHYERVCEITLDTSNKITDVIIPDIDFQDENFLNLCLGNFMLSIARSRRTFVLQDVPVQMDFDAMASEGQTLIDNAMELITDQSLFYLALGG